MPFGPLHAVSAGDDSRTSAVAVMYRRPGLTQDVPYSEAIRDVHCGSTARRVAGACMPPVPDAPDAPDARQGTGGGGHRFFRKSPVIKGVAGGTRSVTLVALLLLLPRVSAAVCAAAAVWLARRFVELLELLASSRKVLKLSGIAALLGYCWMVGTWLGSGVGVGVGLGWGLG